MAKYVTQFELAADVMDREFATTLTRALRQLRAQYNVDVSARLETDHRLYLTVWIEAEALGARRASAIAWHAVRTASLDADTSTLAHSSDPHTGDWTPEWLTLGTVDVRHISRTDEPAPEPAGQSKHASAVQ